MDDRDIISEIHHAIYKHITCDIPTQLLKLYRFTPPRVISLAILNQPTPCTVILYNLDNKYSLDNKYGSIILDNSSIKVATQSRLTAFAMAYSESSIDYTIHYSDNDMLDKLNMVLFTIYNNPPKKCEDDYFVPRR